MNAENINKSQEILRDFIGAESDNIRSVEYAQQCLAIYEETLRAMGLLAAEESSEAVDNSQVRYTGMETTEGEYANLSGCP